ncbi:MAG: hypothetical protein M5R42_01550 [Rhodocyclaceae bacterium]|nr:hypothetical protein [Rhodocyclaceae bacterium]
MNTYKAKHLGLSDAERDRIRLNPGRLIFGVDMKIVDDAGRELPRATA